MKAAPAVVVPTSLDAIICGEFKEMAGMRLTLAQACRLWSLAPAEAQVIFQSLVCRGVLRFDERGRICRPQDAVR